MVKPQPWHLDYMATLADNFGLALTRDEIEQYCTIFLEVDQNPAVAQNVTHEQRSDAPESGTSS